MAVYRYIGREDAKASSSRDKYQSMIERAKSKKKIGFDTITDDIASMNKSLTTSLSEWQDRDTMASTKEQLSSMLTRAGAYKEYVNKNQNEFNGVDINSFNNDMDSLLNFYSSALNSWDNMTEVYSQYKDADAYRVALGDYEWQQANRGMTADEVQKKLMDTSTSEADRKRLESYGVNVGYDSLDEYDADIEAQEEKLKALETDDNVWTSMLKKITGNDEERQAYQKQSAYLDQLKAKRNLYELDNRFSKYSDLMESEDFAEKSQYAIGGNENYEYANDVDGARGDIQNRYSMNDAAAPQWGLGIDEMTEEERKVYNYIYSAQGDHPTDAYLEDMSVVWNKRRSDRNAQKVDEIADESGFVSGLMSVAAVPAGILGGISSAAQTLGDKLYGKELNPYSSGYDLTNFRANVAQSVGSNIEESTDLEIAGVNVARFAYDTGMSIAESALGAATFGKGFTGIMGMSAAAQKMKELKDAGASENEIILGSAAAGIAEAVFEKASLDNLLSAKSADSWLTLVKETAKQSGIEASEEVFTEIANTISDSVIRGGASDLAGAYRDYISQGYDEEEAKQNVLNDVLKNIVVAGAGGALSGGIMGGATSGVNYHNLSGTGNALKSNQAAGELLELASGLNENSEAYQKYQKLKDTDVTKLGNGQLGNLYQMTGQELEKEYGKAAVDNAQSKVVERLEKLGLPADTATEMGELISKYEQGEKLNNAEKKLLKTSRIAQRVISELEHSNSREYSNDWARTGKMSERLEQAQGQMKRYQELTGRMSTDKRGNAIVVEGIDAEHGKLQTSAGTKKEEDVHLSDTDAQLVEAAEFLGEAGNVLIQQYDRSQKVSEYIDAFQLIEKYGEHGLGADNVLKNRGILTESQALEAYKAGVAVRQENVVKKLQEQVDEATAKHLKAATQFRQGSFDDSAVDYRRINRRQKQAIHFTRAFSQMTGVNVVFYSSKADAKGNRKEANGWYDHGTNTIHMDVYAGVNTEVMEDAIIPTLSHELTHWMKEKSPQLYEQLAEVVMNVLTADGKRTIEGMIGTEQARHQRAHGEEMDVEGARDELIARACEDMLAKSEYAKKLLESLGEKERKTLIESVKEAVHNLLQWVKELLGLYESRSEEAKILRSYEEKLQEVSKLWDDMLHSSILANQALGQKGKEKVAPVQLQTMYGWENKKNSHPGTDISNDIPARTPEAVSDMSSSTSSIPQKQKNATSERRFSDRNINRAYELSTYNLEGKWNDYIGVQKEIVSVLKDEGFFDKGTVRNTNSGMDIRINTKSIRETFGNGNRFQKLAKELKELKVATVRHLPDIIENGVLIEDNVANIHGNKELFAYISSDVTIDGKEYRVRITVKKKIGSNVFWIHHVDHEKRVPNYSHHIQGIGHQEIQNSSDTIADDGEDVKIVFSDRATTTIYDYVGETVQLQQENNQLRKDVENLKELLGMLEETEQVTWFTQEQLRERAKFILKQVERLYGKNICTYDAATLALDLEELYTEMSKQDNLEWDVVMNKAYSIAESIAENMKEHKVTNDYFKEVYTMLRAERISLNAGQMAEAINRFGSKGAVHRATFGRLNLTKDGVPLDEKWQQWAAKYPDLFDATTSAEDQITELLDIYATCRDASEIWQQYDKTEVARTISTEIYHQYWQMTPMRFESNKFKDRATQLKHEHRQMMEQLRQQYEMRLDAAVHRQKEEDKQKYEKIIRNVRKHRDEVLEENQRKNRETISYYRDMIQRENEIKKITKQSLKMARWLKKNTPKEHVPEIMKKILGKFLKALDFSSKQLLSIRKGPNAGTPTQRDVSIATTMQEVANMVNAIENSRGVKEKEEYEVLTLDKKYEELYGTYIDLPKGFADHITKFSGEINKLMLEYGDGVKVLNAMSLEELKALNEIVTTLRVTIQNMNEFFANAYFQNSSEASQNTIKELEELGEKSKRTGTFTDFFKWGNTLPYYAFKRYGSGGRSIFEELQDGWDRFAFSVKRVLDFTEETYKAEEARAWSQEVKEILIGNRPVKMTVAQIMSLYCLSKREQAMQHLLGGGMRIADFDAGGKIGKVSQTRGINVKRSTIQKILADHLTDRQREVADKLQEFMNTVCSEWGNEVSMRRFGYKAFGEENYFPIHVDKNNQQGEAETDNENSIYRLLNMSFTKSLTKQASNTIMINDIFDVFAQHATDMAKYNALALPILDALKWYNYTERIPLDETEKEEGSEVTPHKTESVKEVLERVYGQGAKTYFVNFIKDLNGSQEGGRGEEWAHKMMSKYKLAAVGANVRVVLLQPTSYVRASAVMEPKYLKKALKQKPKSEKASKYCGIALWKSLGFYDTSISRGVRAMIKHEETWKDKVAEVSMKGAEWGDRMTWGYLWNACELEIEDTRKDLVKDSEEFYQAVAKRLRDVIYQTQVVDSSMTRTQMM